MSEYKPQSASERHLEVQAAERARLMAALLGPVERDADPWILKNHVARLAELAKLIQQEARRSVEEEI